MLTLAFHFVRRKKLPLARALGHLNQYKDFPPAFVLPSNVLCFVASPYTTQQRPARLMRKVYPISPFAQHTSPNMPPNPKRRAAGRKGRKPSHSEPYQVPEGSSSVAALPSQPMKQHPGMPIKQDTIEVAALYDSTSGLKPVPFSSMADTLDQGLLAGLNGMGFE